MKVAIASPVYKECPPEFVHSLVESLALLRARGHSASWDYVQGSVVHRARNALAHRGLLSGADVLVQVDADQQWPAEDLVNAIECVGSGRADMIGFPNATRFPQSVGKAGGMANLFVSPDLLPADEPLRAFRFEGARYIEVAQVCSIVICSRACIAKLSADAVRDQDGIPVLFDFVRAPDGTTCGEDHFFAARWRAAGGKIHCAVDVRIGHIGKASYSGPFAKLLEGRRITWDAVDDAAAQ